MERINLLLVKMYNPIVKAILRSPLHGLISKDAMLIIFTGRKSGKVYTTPVGYIRKGDDIIFFKQSHNNWWRNLRGGAPVIVRVRGKNLKAIGEIIDDRETVTAGLLAYLQKLPQYAKYFRVHIDPNGQPNLEGVARAAQNRVMIRVQLTQGTIEGDKRPCSRRAKPQLGIKKMTKSSTQCSRAHLLANPMIYGNPIRKFN